MTTTTPSLDEVARTLAEENKQFDPDICRTYWFPDPEKREIRLVHVEKYAVGSDDEVQPAYFRASPQNGVPFRTAVAVIRPEEDTHQLRLPNGWGNWSRAVIWNW